MCSWWWLSDNQIECSLNTPIYMPLLHNIFSRCFNNTWSVKYPRVYSEAFSLFSMPAGYLHAKEEAEVEAEKWAVEKPAKDSSGAQWTVEEKKKQKKPHWWNRRTQKPTGEVDRKMKYELHPTFLRFHLFLNHRLAYFKFQSDTEVKISNCYNNPIIPFLNWTSLEKERRINCPTKK